MHAKLVVVILTVGYHHLCARILCQLEVQTALRSHVWFRWFNEIPVLFLVAAVLLVILKPF
jgi:putative membrane protein